MTLCDHCDLAFHKAPDDGADGCGCRRYECGCRIKREQATK